MLVLTLPLSAVGHHWSPASHPRLTLTHLSSPSIADKAALLTFPNRNRFLQVRIQVKQPAIISPE
jgi:hypothetical protein